MLKVVELFGGIGACTKALKNLGIEFEVVDYVEINKHAVASYNAMNGTHFEPQDIKQWDKDIEADLVMHGSPCQNFSIAGNRTGGDEGSGTHSSLMYETLRIVRKLKPRYVIWENVKNLVGKNHVHNFAKYIDTMSMLGYWSHYKVLNAKDYGIPQQRERVFTVSIRKDLDKGYRFPEPVELATRLKDYLDGDVPEKYFLEDYEIERIVKEDVEVGTDCLPIKTATKRGFIEAYEGDAVDLSSLMEYHRGNVQKTSIHAITGKCGEDKGIVVRCNRVGRLKGKKYDSLYESYRRVYDCNGLSTAIETHCGGNHEAKYETPDLRVRRLTPNECWRLMGFDDESFRKAEEVNSNTQLYKQAGNSIVVPVLEGVIRQLLISDHASDCEIQLSIFDILVE